ncbi:photosystem II protein PsbQ, partial [Escherichia coli]|uniref:photosystem II protein PsbQ n=1 Tax=Escherichia coli TaxID=562 RepID=UPI003B9AE6D7
IKRSPPEWSGARAHLTTEFTQVACSLMAAAQAMASIGAINGSLHLGGSRRASRVPAGRPALFSVRAQQASDEGDQVQASGRRAILGFVATTLAGGALVPAVLAAEAIKVGPPPLPSGGLPGTLNSDEPRDLDLPYKDRFYLQPQSAQQAVTRAKESAKDIVNVKPLIEKKAWPYVMNDLRLKASYLRYDLNAIISTKPKDEKKTLKQLSDTLFTNIDNLDHAAKVKSSKDAEKYYAATVSALSDVLAKLG